MELIADILLAAGALGAGFYCLVLSRRLTRFTDLESGMGGAVAVLSAQVDDLKKTLDKAQGAAGESSQNLTEATARAEDVAHRLELLVASMHDLPPSAPREQPPPSNATRADPVFVRHAGGEGANR